MKALRTLYLSAIASFIIVGCNKRASFENELFDCECGTLSLNNRDLNIRLAAGFNLDASNTDFWRYHIVADYRTEEEQINHTPSEDLSLTVELTYSGSSASGDAVDVLTANYLEIPVDEMWDVTEGTVEVNAGDSIHTLTLSNVVVDGSKTLNGEFTIVPE